MAPSAGTSPSERKKLQSVDPDPLAPGSDAARETRAAVTTSADPLFNREFSWLEFNRRVLAEAENPDVPLLERLKFLAITSTNLDEFFMVRVGGIQSLVTSGLTDRSPDGLTPKQQLRGIRERTKRLLADMYRCWNDSLLPQLTANDIHFESLSDLDPRHQEALESYFHRNIAPMLTPLAVDPGHPFPFLANLSLNMAVLLETRRGEEHYAFVKIPSQAPRLLRVGEPSESRFVLMETLIARYIGSFFPGLSVRRVVPFRLIRNADLSIREDEVEDLLKSVETELRRRERKDPIWLEIGTETDDALVDLLTRFTGISADDVFVAPGPLKLGDLMQAYSQIARPSLRDKPFNPRIPAQLASSDDIFSIIRRGDVLLHRPYDSFSSVVEFVQSAADDPDVIAIKQTLYRVDPGSPIVAALANAATSGKQVTVVVELQARFDEKRNIAWARQLEAAGVQVVYGMVGMKTHCKMCVVVRREGDDLRRYVHLSTGNYNANTGRTYTDIDLFTTDEGMTADALQMMNFLTGFSINSVQDIFEGSVPELRWQRFVPSPTDYHAWTLRMIEREIEAAAAGRPAAITAKMNALVDAAVIRAFYRASQAGVKIELLIRGICCLVPEVPGVSDNIRVTSVVDRFLEHARLFLFRNGSEGVPEVWVSSGDWMPRNFVRRFEVTFPILDARLRQRVEEEILSISRSDNVKGWKLSQDGTYRRKNPAGSPVRSQERFIEIARASAIRMGPYEEMLTRPGSFRRKAKKPRKKEKSKGAKTDGK